HEQHVVAIAHVLLVPARVRQAVAAVVVHPIVAAEQRGIELRADRHRAITIPARRNVVVATKLVAVGPLIIAPVLAQLLLVAARFAEVPADDVAPDFALVLADLAIALGTGRTGRDQGGRRQRGNKNLT